MRYFPASFAAPRLPLSRLALPLLTLVLGALPASAQVVRSGTGSDAAALLSVVDAFRADLGGANNGNLPGAQGTGRREINWDGPGTAADPVAMPADAFFRRGTLFTTPGAGFEISASDGDPTVVSGAEEFADRNPAYADAFTFFSAPKLFSALESTITDVHFIVPGERGIAGFTRGLGVVFTDVDLDTTTALTFFDRAGGELGTWYAPVLDGGLSFLGVSFADASVARVRITSGNALLGADEGAGSDVVVMDDFILGETQAIPEPGTLALAGAGFLGFAAWRRGRPKGN